VQVVFYLTVIISITFVKNGGGAKIGKCAVQNCKDMIARHLNLKTQRFLTRKVL